MSATCRRHVADISATLPQRISIIGFGLVLFHLQKCRRHVGDMLATFFKNQNFDFQRYIGDMSCGKILRRQESIIVFGLRLFHLRHYRQDVAAIHGRAKISFQSETTKKSKVKYIVPINRDNEKCRRHVADIAASGTVKCSCQRQCRRHVARQCRCSRTAL